MKRTSIKLVLLLIPIIIFTIQYFFIQKIYPLYHDPDPAYQYLFNGLLVLNGNSPYHIDHPGTPVQILIACILYISWCVTNIFGLYHESLDLSVGTRPETYLQIISYVLVLLNCTASFILGHRVYKSTLNIGLTLFVQATAISFSVVFIRMSYPEPESLLIFSSMMLIASLAPSLFDNSVDKKSPTTIASVVPGIICGFGVAVKLTFIPMLAMLFLLRAPKYIALSFCSAIISWFVCISPMLKEFPRLFSWVKGIATHSGAYGTGNTEFINSKEILSRLHSLINVFDLWFTVVFLLCGATVGIFIWALFKTKAPEKTNDQFGSIVSLAFTPIILVSICTAQTILVLKHPGDRYMIPSLIIEGIGIAWMIHSTSKFPLFTKLRTLGFRVLVLVGLALMLNAARNSYRQLSIDRQIFSMQMSQIENLIAQYENPILVGTYGCMLPKCALSYGLGYAPGTNPQIGALLTDFFDFNIWNKKLSIRGRGFHNLDIIEQELALKRNILLVTFEPLEQLKAFKLVHVFSGPTQSLYQITGLSGQ